MKVSPIKGRARENAFIRAYAVNGMSARAAARAAGYAEGYASRAVRRLASEIERRRRQLNGMGLPSKFGRTDTRRLLVGQIEAILDYVGPHAVRVREQRIRELAAQHKLEAIQDVIAGLHRKQEKNLQRAGGPAGTDYRLAQIIDYAWCVVREIKAREGMPVYFDPHVLPVGRGEAAATPRKSALNPGDAWGPGWEGSLGAPAPPVTATCAKHPSQPLNGCSLCAALRSLDPTRQWHAEDDVFTEPALPPWMRSGTY